VRRSDLLATSRALRAAAQVIASELAYPKGMRDEIMRQVRVAYLRWLMYTFQQKKKKAEKALGSEGKIPVFRTPEDLSIDLPYFYRDDLDFQRDLREARNSGSLSKEDFSRIDTFFREGARFKDLKGLDVTQLHWVATALENFVNDRSQHPDTRKAARLFCVSLKNPSPH